MASARLFGRSSNTFYPYIIFTYHDFYTTKIARASPCRTIGL